MTERPDPAEQAAPAHISPWPAGLFDDYVEEFSAFYRHEFRQLLSFLAWLGASPADAVELAQDAMAKAFQRWVHIHNPRAWIRTTASRAYARRLASVREEELVDDLVEANLLWPDADLEAFASRNEVLALLGRLPTRQRQIMAWRYDGYTPTEIATQLGLTDVAVRSSLRKARTTLARHLATRTEADPR
jgi:RNA polymerase sigma-70 factor (ECF subfamily)